MGIGDWSSDVALPIFPFGIARILVTGYELYEEGLYAEILLNGYYLAMSIYGWAHWVARHNQPQVVASYSERSDWYITLLIVAIGFPVLYFTLVHFTDSTVPGRSEERRVGKAWVRTCRGRWSSVLEKKKKIK